MSHFIFVIAAMQNKKCCWHILFFPSSMSSCENVFLKNISHHAKCVIALSEMLKTNSREMKKKCWRNILFSFVVTTFWSVAWIWKHIFRSVNTFSPSIRWSAKSICALLKVRKWSEMHEIRHFCSDKGPPHAKSTFLVAPASLPSSLFWVPKIEEPPYTGPKRGVFAPFRGFGANPKKGVGSLFRRSVWSFAEHSINTNANT